MVRFTDVFRRFLNRTTFLRWGKVRSVDILVLDSGTGGILIDLLSEFGTVGIFESRFLRYEGKTIPISLGILGRVLFYFFKGLNLYNAYIAACIRSYNPKIVVDRGHSLNLLEVSRRVTGTRFLLIQNGSWLRSTRAEVEADRFVQHLSRMDLKLYDRCHLFCFGEDDVEKVNIRCPGRLKGLITHPIGSLVGGLFQRELPLSPDPSFGHWDICFISQAVPSRLNTVGTLSERRKKAYSLINEFLNRYSRTWKKKVIVCPRLAPSHPQFQEERDFFESFFSKNEYVDILERQDSLDSYRAIQNSGLVLSLYSSMGIESIGFGKKVAIFPFYHDDVFRLFSDVYEEDQTAWKWLSSEPDYGVFEELLQQLEALSDIDYSNQQITSMERLGAYDSHSHSVKKFSLIVHSMMMEL